MKLHEFDLQMKLHSK